METKTLRSVQTQNQELLNSRRKSREEFGNIAHRLETVAVINDVEFINDSKATDVNSTWYSLLTVQNDHGCNIIWILSVSETEMDFNVFYERVERKVKSIVCLGSDGNQAQRVLRPVVDQWMNVATVEDAVKAAAACSSRGDIVLFSPACSGYDKFQNYRDRGEQFRKAVQRLLT